MTEYQVPCAGGIVGIPVSQALNPASETGTGLYCVRVQVRIWL